MLRGYLTAEKKEQPHQKREPPGDMGKAICAPAFASASPERQKDSHCTCPRSGVVIQPPFPVHGQIPIRSEIVRLSPVPSFTVHSITDPRPFKRTTSLTSFTPNPGSQLADRWITCASGPLSRTDRAAAAPPPPPPPPLSSNSNQPVRPQQLPTHCATALAVRCVPCRPGKCGNGLKKDKIDLGRPCHSYITSAIGVVGSVIWKSKPCPDVSPCEDHGSDGAASDAIMYLLV
ncbi:hypothetical protein LZ30DRAFT_310136 [Colletotrichum cereale]|nr:hypothetical protein LZ30DRAFT_310136 [Colletotrichum cereale]